MIKNFLHKETKIKFKELERVYLDILSSLINDKNKIDDLYNFLANIYNYNTPFELMVDKFFVFPVQRDLLKYWLYHQQAIVQKIELTSFSLNIFNDVCRFAEIYQLYGSKESSSQNSIDDLMFNYSQVANHQLITFLMQRIENSRGFTN